MRILPLAALAAATILAGAAGAAKLDPAAAIQARQAGMKQIGRNFKAINDQMHGGAPDGQAIAAAAHALAELAPRVPSWFPAGTGPDSGVKTAVKPEVWSQAPDFRAKAKALALAARNLDAAAAKGGDPAALQPLVQQLGGACKACHTAYKAQDH
ncbi:MAG: cytochrome c [Allosphingosinicella sp.]